MSSWVRLRGSPGSGMGFGAWAATGAAGLVLGLLLSSPGLAVALAGGFLAVVVLYAVPARALPAIALAAFALLPAKHLPFPGEPATLNLTLLVVIIWMTRANGRDMGRPKVKLRAVGILLAVIGALVLSSLFSAQRSVSAGWSFSFVLLGLGPIVLLQLADRSAHDLARRTWVILGGALGAFAVFEKFLLEGNPLYGFAYRSAKPALLQVWSTYRATTTLGHPLTNALFFAVACVLAYGAWRRSNRRLDLACGFLAAFGLLATVSRAGIVALVAGLLTIVLLDVATTRSERSRRFTLPAMVAVVGVLVFFGSGSIADRNQSSEGSSSYRYRATTVQDGLPLAQRSPIVGVGVGSADAVRKSEATGRFRSVGLENSWVGLIAGLGLPGTACVLLLLVVVGMASIRRGDPVGAGALATYVVMAASFNLLEQNRPAHVIFGLIVGMALDPGRERDGGDQVEPSEGISVSA